MKIKNITTHTYYIYKISSVTVSSHMRSTVHSILKSVFLEIQNTAIRLVLSGPVTYTDENIERM